MIYLGEIYSESEIYGEGIDIDESFVELYDDIVIYIYKNSVKLSLKYYRWYFYKFTTDWVLIDNDKINDGTISLNLNDYGLQNTDIKLRIKVFDNNGNQILLDNVFWYYHNSYPINGPLLYENIIYDIPQGSTYVEPLKIQQKMPNVRIKKIHKNDKLINISIKRKYNDQI